jgi:hypothetical protein
MMKPKGKGTALLIAPVLGGGLKKPAAPSADDGDGDEELGQMAMERFIAAVRGGKPKAAWAAFKAAQNCCGGGMGEGEPEGDE